MDKISREYKEMVRAFYKIAEVVDFSKPEHSGLYDLIFPFLKTDSELSSIYESKSDAIESLVDLLEQNPDRWIDCIRVWSNTYLPDLFNPINPISIEQIQRILSNYGIFKAINKEQMPTPILETELGKEMMDDFKTLFKQLK